MGTPQIVATRRYPAGPPSAILTALAVVAAALVGAADGPTAGSSSRPEGPDFKAVLDVPSVGDPQISSDGRAIAYTVRSADWDDNRYDTEIWVTFEAGEPYQLTRTEGSSSTHPRWSPDGESLAFLADRGEDTQIWMIRAGGGEARPLTDVEDGVDGFEWSPRGDAMAVTIRDALSKSRKKTEESYGKFAVEDAEFRMTHLWVLDVEATLATRSGAELPSPEEEGEDETSSKDDPVPDKKVQGEQAEAKSSPLRRLTEGEAFTINDFRWSPDGTRIAFEHAPDPRVESFSHSDISIVDVASGRVDPLVGRSGPDGDPHWSPDGKWILFGTGNGQAAYYLNSELAKVPAAGGEPVVLTAGFDEDTSPVAWLEDGIRFLALDRTHRRLYRLAPDGEGAPELLVETPRIVWSVDFSGDGQVAAIAGEGPETVREIYRLGSGSAHAKAVTQLTKRTAEWPVGTREMIEWTSRDGASIEGVLLKPEDFDPDAKHPLLVIIHGGPAWLSYPARLYAYVYPVQQWLAKGAVVLMPNYRGSAGYGERFRALNVRNLGVGDAWDVLAGVDHLVEQGFVDTARMGAMGWSQGGYISAFLTTTSDRFQAISVGAGISNWMTYYVNTDVHPFTRHYLEATPWDDPEVYAKTSPMTYIKDAKTPTLIQHGEHDKRVPVPNAYELYQGLQDVGVETKLIIYKGFGHGISKPKERLAATWHNWQWFAKHIWGEAVELE